MSCWEINSRGFLPTEDPCFVIKNDKLEQLASDLPYFMANKKVRTTLVSELKELKGTEELVNLNGLELERAMMFYSYFASAFVHATDEPTSKFIPKEISVLLVDLAAKVERKPILSYASYCLTNWCKKEFFGPISLDNISLMQHFISGEYKRDEAGFILDHVAIEAAAGNAINKLLLRKETKLIDILKALLDSLRNMNDILNIMQEICRSDVYYKYVRPYIFGFDNVIYENCFNNVPQTYRGETGAQSSIIPAFQTVLGVKHKQSSLTMHLDEMRQYMPLAHREFLIQLEDTNLNNFVKAYGSKELVELYNECLSQFIKFRMKHLEYAISYIQNKVTNPKGTGGTPFIKWLSELIKETEEYFVK